MKRTKAYNRIPLVGGFNFKTGKHKPSSVSKRAPISNVLESDYQVAFFDFLRLNKRQHQIFDDVFHVPNGGHRHEAVALQLRAEGVKPGQHDIFLDVARRGFHGFRVENKVNDNDLTEDQSHVRKRLIEENYFAHTAWHYAEAIAMLLWYLDIPFQKVQGLPNRHAIILPTKGGHDARCGCADFRIEEVKWW